MVKNKYLALKKSNRVVMVVETEKLKSALVWSLLDDHYEDGVAMIRHTGFSVATANDLTRSRTVATVSLSCLL